jgi:hypothetical protein
MKTQTLTTLVALVSTVTATVCLFGTLHLYNCTDIYRAMTGPEPHHLLPLQPLLRHVFLINPADFHGADLALDLSKITEVLASLDLPVQAPSEAVASATV